MALAAYISKVQRTGTPTTFVDAQLTRVTGTRYQVTDEPKRLLDSSGTFVVKGSGTTISPTDYNISFLDGFVIFNTSRNASTNFTLSGSYIPTLDIAGANSYALTLSSTVLDTTDFRTTGTRTKISGLIDASLTLGKFYEYGTDFKESLKNRERVIIILRPSANEQIIGWYVVETDGNEGDIAALETESLAFQSDNRGNEFIVWSVV